ncbi:PAS domain-containing protein [Kitasatospora cinereorecta]
MSSRPTRGAARLASILDALPDALLLVNSNGTVVDANRAAVESLQAPGTSLVGMGVLDLLPEFDPSRIPGSMRPPKSETESLDRPVRMTARRTDGTTFSVEVSGNDFTDEGGGEPHGFLSYATTDQDLLLLLVRDLSARLGVETELRRQHKQTEMILRAAAEGVLGVDLDGRVVLVNPAAAHILDYRASELGGRELHPLIQHSQPDGSPLALEGSALLDTLLSGRKHRVKNTVLWRKDGTPVTVDLTTAPVRDGDQLVGAVMTFTDRTRELALTARNEHLTAVLENELGSALTALHRRIDALAADPAGQLWPEANWTLRRLADECRRFGKLIDGVLEHQRFESSVESAKQALEREPVGLDGVVQLAVEQAGELVGPGRVRYSVHAAAVEVPADRERLARALAHLVADVSGVTPSLEAAAGSPSLGVPALPPIGGDAPMVVLAAAQRGDVARIEVRGPARKASPVHLPIARATVERHGGVLQRHELPGRAGTTYVVELPLDPETVLAGRGQRSVPKDSDTAMLPDLPEVSGPAPAGREERGVEPGPKTEQPTPANTPAAGTPVAEAGPGRPDGHPEQDRRAEPDARERTDGAGTQVAAAPERPSRRRRAAARAEEAAAEPSGPRTPIALGPAGDAGESAPRPPEEPARTGRRRRGSRADEESHGALSIPGIPDPGTPVYPGLEHALPAAPPEPVVPAPAQPTGRRRRLALPADHADAAEAATTVLPVIPAEPQPSEAAQSGGAPDAPAAGGAPARPAAELELSRPAVPPMPSGQPQVPAQPQPVGSGLGELAPPRPMGGGFASAFPGAFPQQAAASPAPDAPADGGSAAVRSNGQGFALAPVAAGGRAAARQGFELAPAGGGDRPAPSGFDGAPAPGEIPAARNGFDAAPGPHRTGLAAAPGAGGGRRVRQSFDSAPEAGARAPFAVGPAGVVAQPGFDGAPAAPDAPGAGAAEAAPAGGPLALPAASGPGTPPGPVDEPAGSAQDEPDFPAVVAPAADGGARRLLVWPEPDPSTKQALQDRGYRPVIVRSREEVDAQVAGLPAALFVDPLTGPITRTALQSLRTAALNSRVPVLVTAGLGQATKDAAYGAEPAVLLRALAPRDSENHAARVLLVESDPDIAAALVAGLERRGMHVDHAADENEAVARASSVQPNLVVMDLLQIRRRRVGLLDWLQANDRLHRTPLVVYTSVDLDPQELPRLRTGETVLFLAERSTTDEVQARIVDLLARIGAIGEVSATAGPQAH